MTSKRKRTVLSIEKKLEIIDRVEKGETYSSLAQEYGIGKTTIRDLKLNKERIISFASSHGNFNPKQRKTLKNTNYCKLEEALYSWILERQNKNDEPLSGPLICQRAMFINSQINGDPNFKASTGWLSRFKSRHNLIFNDGFKISNNGYEQSEENAFARDKIMTRACKQKTISNKISLEFDKNISKINSSFDVRTRCSVIVLEEGYSYDDPTDNTSMVANGTSTLIKSPEFIVVVDTLSPPDSKLLITALEKQGVQCSDVTHVVCTHGHLDHVGNVNLFPQAQHIMGFTVAKGNVYSFHPFQANVPFVISDDIEVLPTPGHTTADVTVVVKNTEEGTVSITGDLFEKMEDIRNPTLWKDIAGSENWKEQYHNRQRILELSNFIIPGHGPKFQVTSELVEMHREQIAAFLSPKEMIKQEVDSGDS